MSLSIEIEDGRGGTRNKVAVTPRGQLVVAPIDFSSTTYNTMTVNDQAYNYVTPVRNRQFIITGIIVSGDRNVGTGGSEVEIYEATAVDSTVVSNGLFQFTVGKNITLPITGLNVITNPGTWINAKMDDNNVNLTILGYSVST
jgi:hypothetical protein